MGLTHTLPIRTEKRSLDVTTEAICTEVAVVVKLSSLIKGLVKGILTLCRACSLLLYYRR